MPDDKYKVIYYNYYNNTAVNIHRQDYNVHIYQYAAHYSLTYIP